MIKKHLIKIIVSITLSLTLTNYSYSSESGPVFGTKPKEAKNASKQEQKKYKPKLSREELFQKADSNKNGDISKEEFMDTNSAKRSPLKASISFATMDLNKDSTLSLEEFKNPPKRQYKK
jgi:hypothetical protein